MRGHGLNPRQAALASKHPLLAPRKGAVPVRNCKGKDLVRSCLWHISWLIRERIYQKKGKTNVFDSDHRPSSEASGPWLRTASRWQRSALRLCHSRVPGALLRARKVGSRDAAS